MSGIVVPCASIILLLESLHPCTWIQKSKALRDLLRFWRIGRALQDTEAHTVNKGPVLLCVQGSATNQDGRSSSLTAPNGPAQQALILLAFSAAPAELSGMSLLATHGTGTPLGDPIETGAIGAALTKIGSQQQGAGAHVMLSSVKARYGHTEGTAGKLPILMTTNSAFIE